MRPHPDHLTFGQAEEGTPVPAQPVRLTGPPIARACTLRPSQDWIRCTLTPDGFEVIADTTHPGHREATIEIKAPPAAPPSPYPLTS